MMTWIQKNGCTGPIQCFAFNVYGWVDLFRAASFVNVPIYSFFLLGYKYEGVKFERGNCGVSIMRSGKLNLPQLTHEIGVFPLWVHVRSRIMSPVLYGGCTFCSTHIHQVRPLCALDCVLFIRSQFLSDSEYWMIQQNNATWDLDKDAALCFAEHVL